MIMRVTAMVFVLGFAALASAGGAGVAWDSPDAAPAKSAVTGKPVCYYFTNTEVVKTGST